MWKIVIFAVCLLSVNAEKTIDDLVGEWTPVANFPGLIFMPICIKYSLHKSPNNTQCECADGKTSELVEGYQYMEGNLTAMVKFEYPMLVTEDMKDVTSSLNVTCSCAGKGHSTRVIARSLNDNYFVLYRSQTITNKEPNSALLYARNIPSYLELYGVITSTPELSNRAPGIMCTSEYEEAFALYTKNATKRDKQVRR